MIVRIAVQDLRPGMYIDSIECSWLESPFWRRRFALRDAEDIARLKQSAIAFVAIDTDRGLAPVSPVVPAAVPMAIDLPTVHGRRSRAVPATESLETMLERSKQQVHALFQDVRLGRNVTVAAVSPLVDDITLRVRRDAVAMVAGTRQKPADDYTYLHSIAVCALLIQLAIHLGFDDEQVRAIGAAGLLHDIGKATTPDEILLKPGVLDAGELAVMRRHAASGHAILRDLGEADGITLDVCLHHHERLDGQGYPEGLAADAISIHARMAAICDVYDAVTSIRPYKRPWSPNEALARMGSWEGHFDPVLLDSFITMLGIHPVGALVRTRSNRLGIVLDGSVDPFHPRVRTFFDVPPAAFLAPEDVDTAHDPVLRREREGYWFGDNWPAIVASIGENRRFDPPAPPQRSSGA